MFGPSATARKAIMAPPKNKKQLPKWEPFRVSKGEKMKTANKKENKNTLGFQSKVLRQTQDKVARMLRIICQSETERGTFFFRSDTGTGKPTGFIRAVTDLVKTGNTFAIAVPTTQDAEEVYQRLKETLGDQVEVWTSDHGKGKYGMKIDKSSLKMAPVFVGCHAFLMGKADDPRRFIGRKDVLLIDEIPTNLAINSLTYADFAKAREKAHEAGLCSGEIFAAADDWMRERQEKAENEVNQAAFNQIAHLVSEELHKARNDLDGLNANDKAALLPVLDYFEALKDGRGFERVQRTGAGHLVHQVYFEDIAKHFLKSVVFSATAHLDGFQFSPNKDRLDAFEGSYVKYPNLDIREVPFPRVSKAARYIVQNRHELETAVSHVRDIISKTDEGSRVLVVVPKPLKDWVEQDCYRNPNQHNSAIYVTNWGRDIGSNEYRDCTEVILWANHHKPKHTTFSELCLYAEERVNRENLKEVRKGKFTGRALSLEQAQLYAAIKQMGSRGTTRFVNDDGNAWPMRLWVSWAELRPELLKDIFPESDFMREPVTDERFISKSKREIVPRVIDILTTVDKDEIMMSEVADTIPNAPKNSQKFLDARTILNTYGWDFVQGKRGRNGYQARFVVVNKNKKPEVR